jgi:hypothetical protein
MLQAMAQRMSPGDMQVWHGLSLQLTMTPLLLPASLLPLFILLAQVSDIVTLLPACDRTCWLGVSMHCDDYGVARGLPVRATDTFI